MSFDSVGSRRMPAASAVTAIALVLATFVKPAFAEPPPVNATEPTREGAASTDEATKQRCVGSFKRAQRLLRRSQLLSARAELYVCGQPECPDVVEVKCVGWLEEVRRAIPTVVVAALDEHGHDVVDAEVAIDDDALALSLDGLPLELDPGPHNVRVTHRGRSVSQRILAVQGAQNRPIQLRFEVPRTPVSDRSSPGFQLPVLSWLGFGLGATGLVVGTATGIAAILEAKALDCPNDICFQYQEDALFRGRALAHTATASFVVAGVGSLVGVAGLTWLRPKGAAPAPLRIGLAVTPGSLGLEGTF